MNLKNKKRTAIKIRPQRQRGVAAIMFAIMLPVLMGFITLGVEGGRYLALKGQFRDAAEVASLMISARGSEKDAENQTLAKAVVQAMVSDIDGLAVKVIRDDCDLNEANNNCGDSSDKRQFFQSQVEITSDHNNWFPDWTGDGMGFPEKISFQTDVAVRKYYGSGIDVVFVADFSGSMNCEWGESKEDCEKKEDNKSKIKTLRTVITNVATKLEEYSTNQQYINTMALVPFTGHTREKKGKSYRPVMQVKVNVTYDKKGKPLKPSFEIDQAYQDIFKEKPLMSLSDLLHDNDEKGTFHTVALTPDATELDTALNTMEAGGWTASFEGIIRAAQIAQNGKNPYRLIVVLSDGQDSGPLGTYPKENIEAHEDLLDPSYCDKIRNGPEEKLSGKYVNPQIAVIGIDYDAKSDPNLQTCAGEDNVYTAKDMDEVYDLLLSLIKKGEEVGQLYY